ncbi:MAG: DivIVA domain-containing protein [Clostridia bacterium]|nr:DivIVA domain-containing protein [Clostridia bacterium]
MEFSIAKKGYNTEEVDAYVEDLQAKYARLQSLNTELEQKLATAKRLIRRFSDTENALKQNIADSKRAAAYMISDAKDRSADLLENARESCGEIISELDMEIASRMDTVELMKAEVASFKEALFSLYSSHIEMIDTLAQVAEDYEYEPDYSAVAEAVDTFEEHGEPECSVPEFVEYPEESIFAEMEEAEQAAEGFVLDGAVEFTEDGEIVFESEEEPAPDMGQIAFVEEDEADISFGLFDDSEEETEDEEISFDAPEVKDVEAENISESDYFKFLSDFANSDEGEL